MYHMRPGIKVPFWPHRYKNKQDVDAPALLRLVAALSMISIVGTLVYAVYHALSTLDFYGSGTYEPLYIALLHFVLPFMVLYTISTNSWLSRPFIALYNLILFGATVTGHGVLGSIGVSEVTKVSVASVFLLAVLLWLYASPTMRVYYALISGRPIPEGLEHKQDRLNAGRSLSPKWRGRVEWLLDNLETLVMVGFIIACILAYLGTTNYG